MIEAFWGKSREPDFLIHFRRADSEKKGSQAKFWVFDHLICIIIFWPFWTILKEHVALDRSSWSIKVWTMKDWCSRFQFDAYFLSIIIWWNVHCSIPELSEPMYNGWEHGDSEPQPILMSMSQILKSYLLEDTLCSCQKHGFQCTAMCAFQQQIGDETRCMATCS